MANEDAKNYLENVCLSYVLNAKKVTGMENHGDAMKGEDRLQFCFSNPGRWFLFK